MNAIGIFLGIYALVLWVALFYAWRRGYHEWKNSRANRIYIYQARVLDKRNPSTSEFLILFEFAGRQKELEVPEPVYTALRIGHEGTLCLKGKGFDSFEPKSEAERADDLYQKMVKS